MLSQTAIENDLVKEMNDPISVEGINQFLKQPSHYSIQVFDTVSSTNQLLKDAAKKGAPNGTVFVANEQQAGRGRLGRNFFSPAGSGIYFSLLIRQTTPRLAFHSLPALVAVAAANGIDEGFAQKTQIKWVNDIYLNEKKISGILLEGVTDLKNPSEQIIVIGIGINVYQPTGNFPTEITKRAGYLLENYQKDARNRLVAEFLNRWEYFNLAEHKARALSLFRKKNYLQGKTVSVSVKNKRLDVKVLDINDDFELVVQNLQNCETLIINHGEATLHFDQNI